MNIIELKLEHRQTIAKLGEASYPHECRGLLLGHRNGIAKRIVEIVFHDESPQPPAQDNRYLVSSQEMREGEEIAREKGLELLGAFLSHVDRPARPSSADRQLAQPTFAYIVVGIRDGRAHELTAWTLSEDRSAFYQEEMRDA
jgi:proteasome lid subunit RPN8/RPN11